LTKKLLIYVSEYSPWETLFVAGQCQTKLVWDW